MAVRAPGIHADRSNRTLYSRRERAFTMVEIAIALGVIGFALVAIIGILPAGLEVQRDNRSETIINQDGTFWLEAIRNGALGLDDLSNHVEEILTPEGNFGWGAGGLAQGNPGTFTYGRDIVGLLTSALDKGSNQVEAIVSAISGSAAEKDTDKDARELSFKYRLNVQITNAAAPSPFAALALAPEPMASLYEIRVVLSYPYIEARASQSPSRRQVYRAVVSRGVVTNVINGITNMFFVP